jgi:hypothetical protein
MSENLLNISSIYKMSYQCNTEQTLKSAYWAKNGMESVYTNFSDTPPSSNFCAILDYIFFSSDHLIVRKVFQLSDHSTGESYLDETDLCLVVAVECF